MDSTLSLPVGVAFCAGLLAGLGLALGIYGLRRFGALSTLSSKQAEQQPPSAALKHEIRTLVSSVVGLADLLADRHLHEDPSATSALLRQTSQNLVVRLQSLDGFSAPAQPVAEPSGPSAAAPPAAAPDPDVHILSLAKKPVGETTVRKRVLVVEDNAINQLVVLGYLKRHPLDVVAVANGQEAISTLARERFDLVLMDCAMPVMDGYEATRQIRRAEGEGRGRLPIVAVTANATLEDEANCRAAGMDDYVTKPLQLTTMDRVLVQWGCA
jgi:CheY-like chemotaxis protein